MNKSIYIIAGPNGSGKTTFASKFLPRYANCQHFINADLIAKGLSPFSPNIAAIKAGRLVLEQIHELANKNVSFAFETTLSGKTYLKFLKNQKSRGYQLHLFFLWIPNSELAIARINDRVAEGGHNVPAHDVNRRFGRSIFNLFKVYFPILDSIMLFDNTGSMPNLIAEQKNGKLLVVDKSLYDKIRDAL
ncbi:MAG: zeta toxin family protein [Elusimicrobia bacterium]|nr:zeta toxin family protein [Elusimicrobiota bacterium]MBU2614982.1 zeta toxin family protein [Elusimicrobiota bacterium]